MNFPEELKYTREHEWVRVEGDKAYVGITDFAQRELGDIVYMDVSSVCETIESNAIFGTIEAVKTVSDLFMPVTAEVIEFNTNLENNPELVNSDPYGEGWIICIRLSNQDELNNLLSCEEYRQLIGE